jgi:methylase of polypeptide subunit release factors
MEHDYSNLYFSTTGERKLKVYYQPGLDGGGTWFGQEYPEILAARYPGRVFERCYEWCCGPAFIGYNILDHGLCKTLCLSDIHQPAIDQVHKTIADPHNNCQDRVTAYCTGDVGKIPQHEMFDLIVGNPPHFPGRSDDANTARVESDVDWKVHVNFYANIARHLTPDGVILLQENAWGSDYNTFREMIWHAGLKMTDCFNSPKWFHPGQDCQIYYLELVHK